MKPNSILAALLALTVAVWSPPAACAQGSIVDTQMEVTTAVVQSELTTEAIKKADDAKTRGLVEQRDRAAAQRDALAAQVKAGKAQKAGLVTANKVLASANDALVARLAATNTEYKVAIDVFRGAVTDIASTPEGLAALARFNAGDQVGALAILDKLQAADEAARQKATNIQKAVGERHIAALALDARDKSKVTTDSVIARYKAVVKLDPGVFLDWISLDRLYQAAGRTADARAAAATAAKIADNDRDKSVALSELGDVLQTEGDLAGACNAYAEDLAISRRLAAAHPTNAGARLDLAVALSKTGDVLRAQGDLAGAGKAFAELLAIFRPLATADPTNTGAQRDLSAALDRTGSVLLAQGDLAGASRAYAEMLAIFRRLAAADPTNAVAQRDLSLALARTGDVLRAQGDLAGAGKAYTEMLAIRRPLAAADPTNAGAQQDVADTLGSAGRVLQAQGDLAGARRAYAEMLAILRPLAAADPTNAGTQRDVAVALFNLASARSPVVHWSDAVAQMEAMDAKGMLGPTDRPFLALARANLAKAAGK
jgi:tetratricopeptide (TPR) repeat protein